MDIIFRNQASHLHQKIGSNFFRFIHKKFEGSEFSDLFKKKFGSDNFLVGSSPGRHPNAGTLSEGLPNLFLCHFYPFFTLFYMFLANLSFLEEKNLKIDEKRVKSINTQINFWETKF